MAARDDELYRRALLCLKPDSKSFLQPTGDQFRNSKDEEVLRGRMQNEDVVIV